ncbi:hypothetical protein QBC46DRAFT_26555 [Diplogelasinospora grovesii]|uniref:Uncharacterized protein n=1 Tax=Diplogelasinospora grovesii TaxID=303347 RepID=A0AAN6N1N0_9PEZI|nr:hypothetical protein QBC46DRAFT_26555 [Diplogelasinospora grovesii]
MSITALPPTFTPSPTCFAANNFWAIRTTNRSSDIYLQHGPPLREDPGCYPPLYLPYSTLYYTPGACPSGYTTACSSIIAGEDATQTAQFCCPSAQSFVCANRQTDAISQYARSSWLSSFGCWSSITAAQTFTSVPVVGLSPSQLPVVATSRGMVVAYAIQIRTQAGDASMPTITSTASGTRAANAEVTDASTPSVTPSSDPTPSDTTNGVKVGIGLSIAFGVLVLGMLAWTFSSRTRGSETILMAKSIGWETTEKPEKSDNSKV